MIVDDEGIARDLLRLRAHEEHAIDTTPHLYRSALVLLQSEREKRLRLADRLCALAKEAPAPEKAPASSVLAQSLQIAAARATITFTADEYGGLTMRVTTCTDEERECTMRFRAPVPPTDEEVADYLLHAMADLEARLYAPALRTDVREAIAKLVRKPPGAPEGPT